MAQNARKYVFQRSSFQKISREACPWTPQKRWAKAHRMGPPDPQPSITFTKLWLLKNLKKTLHRHNNWACWIINLLLGVLLCNIVKNFCSLFAFGLALQVCQNTQRKNTQRYYTTKRLIRYMYLFIYFKINLCAIHLLTVTRHFNYPSYQFNVLRLIVFSRKFNVYFALSKEYALKVNAISSNATFGDT